MTNIPYTHKFTESILHSSKTKTSDLLSSYGLQSYCEKSAILINHSLKYEIIYCPPLGAITIKAQVCIKMILEFFDFDILHCIQIRLNLFQDHLSFMYCTLGWTELLSDPSYYAPLLTFRPLYMLFTQPKTLFPPSSQC